MRRAWLQLVPEEFLSVRLTQGLQGDVTCTVHDYPQIGIATMLCRQPACEHDGMAEVISGRLTAVQVSDGASAVLLMTRAEAQKRGLPILGIWRSFSAVGVPPAVMGIGPAYAIPDAVKRAGLTLDDIDVFELNEAFASQVIPHAGQLSWHFAVCFPREVICRSMHNRGWHVDIHGPCTVACNYASCYDVETMQLQMTAPSCKFIKASA